MVAGVRQRGMTLVELMVATGVFVFLSALCYAKVNAAIRQTELVRAANQDLIALQRTLQWLANDFIQQQPRPVRSPVGNTELPSLLVDPGSEFLFEITRTGHANPLGLPRAAAQRIFWRLDESTLVRGQWPVLDPVLSSEPVEVEFLEDISAVEIRLLADGQSNWIANWPGPGGDIRPRGVEITFEHQRLGRIRRVLETGL